MEVNTTKAGIKRRNFFKFILMGLVLLLIASGVFLFNLFHRTTKSPVLNNADRNEKWTADLKYVKEELPKKHENLFFYKTKDIFNNEMDLLISNVEKYSDADIKGELARIVNSINDSHTSVDIRGNLVYPLSFFQFENDIYLVNSSLEHKDFWGTKLLAVNGYSVDQLRTKLDPYVSKDNAAISKEQFSSLLGFVEPLQLAGIAKGDETMFTFEDSIKRDVSIKPMKMADIQKTTLLTTNSEYLSRFPLPKQKSDSYWFKYLEDKKAVYVKYNACLNMQGYSFSQFTKDVFETVDAKNAEKLIIDFRDNGGGNSMIFNPFLKEIKKRDSINKKENLYAVVGRRTFSSAILNAMELKNSTNATLIGEPTGGKPNHFGEVKTIHLSNVNINIYYSSNYFKTSSVDTDSIYPDVEVKLKASSFFNGKDDVLEYIFSR